MADLLPSTPDASAAEGAEPRVVGVDSDDADDLVSALSSDTARDVLGALHDDPSNPSALADRVDTSLQNAQYHLANLEDAGLVEVVDTVYSEKGREMDVYAPTDRPLVLFAGREEQTTGLREALTTLLGGVGVVGLAALVVERLYGTALDGLFSFLGGTGGARTGGASEPDATFSALGDGAAAAAPTGPPPGLVFFAGGVAVLLGAFGVWYARQRLR